MTSRNPTTETRRDKTPQGYIIRHLQHQNQHLNLAQHILINDSPSEQSAARMAEMAGRLRWLIAASAAVLSMSRSTLLFPSVHTWLPLQNLDCNCAVFFMHILASRGETAVGVQQSKACNYTKKRPNTDCTKKRINYTWFSSALMIPSPCSWNSTTGEHRRQNRTHPPNERIYWLAKNSGDAYYNTAHKHQQHRSA